MSLVLAATLSLPAWYLLRQACDLEDSTPARVALYHSPLGTEPTDEYTPINADPDALHPHDPAYWLIPTQTPGAPQYSASATPELPAPLSLPPGQAPTHLDLQLPATAYLVLNRRAYPQWEIERNHQRVTADDYQRADGLLVISLPAGHSVVDLAWHPTPDQHLGLAVSALAILLSVVLAFMSRHKKVLTPAL